MSKSYEEEKIRIYNLDDLIDRMEKMGKSDFTLREVKRTVKRKPQYQVESYQYHAFFEKFNNE